MGVDTIVGVMVGMTAVDMGMGVAGEQPVMTKIRETLTIKIFLKMEIPFWLGFLIAHALFVYTPR